MGDITSSITEPVGVVADASLIRALESKAEYLANPTLSATAIIPMTGFGLDAIFNGTTEWKRNGSAASSPESDRVSGVFRGDPFLCRNAATGVEFYRTQFYFRTQYSDPDIGTVDYTYSREPSSMYYNFPAQPWRYDKDGNSTADPAIMQVRLILGCWQNSVWKIRLSGSSVWDVVTGAQANFAAYSQGGVYARVGTPGITFDGSGVSVKSLGDAAVSYLNLHNKTQYDPRVLTGTIAEKKRIGYQWYVAPVCAMLFFTAHGRKLN